MLDDRVGKDDSHGSYVGQHVWSAASNQFGWNAYLGASPDWERISRWLPARAADVSGLPGVFLAVGSLDLFARESLELAARLLTAGVATELYLFPGAYHGFQMAVESISGRHYQLLSESALRRASAQ